MQFAQDPLSQVFRYAFLSPCVCLCHYQDSCVLSGLLVLSMISTQLLLSGRIDPHHVLVRSEFQDLSFIQHRCAHDITDFLNLGYDSDATELCHRVVESVICLRALALGECLDIAMEGVGVLLTPECRQYDETGLKLVIELFCGGFSGWSHVTRFLHGWDPSLMTTFTLDIDAQCLLAYHLILGATLIGLCPWLELGRAPAFHTCRFWFVSVTSVMFTACHPCSSLSLKSCKTNKPVSWTCVVLGACICCSFFFSYLFVDACL